MAHLAHCSDNEYRLATSPKAAGRRTATYVIGKECVDVMHKDCVQECPAYCIYERARSLYINQYERVDCGACKLICEVGAIYYEPTCRRMSDAPLDLRGVRAGSTGSASTPRM